VWRYDIVFLLKRTVSCFPGCPPSKRCFPFHRALAKNLAGLQHVG
jgi:hypothetical protein